MTLPLPFGRGEGRREGFHFVVYPASPYKSIMPLEVMARRSTEMFRKCFGRAPRWLIAAPGRVNLIGEHTDYNDGFVLPMAIERFTLIAADQNHQSEANVYSETNGETASFSVQGPVTPGDPHWSNYIRGVVAGFQELDGRVSGFDAVIESSLPYGGGLASSAALEVSVATLIEELRKRRLAPLVKALLCQEAEHRFAGVPCGIMDQFTSILAKQDEALLLDCRARSTTPVKMKDPGVAVLIINTNVRHKLAEGEYARRRAECETAARALGLSSLREANLHQLNAARRKLDPVIYRRARHVLTENDRTLRAARAIEQRDWETCGQLMYASHESLRSDYEVSCPELDAVVEIARSIGLAGGVIGCRMTGAGFGGCAVSLIKSDSVQLLSRAISEAYERRTRVQPMLFSSRPAAGVRLLKLVR